MTSTIPPIVDQIQMSSLPCDIGSGYPLPIYDMHGNKLEHCTSAFLNMKQDMPPQSSDGGGWTEVKQKQKIQKQKIISLKPQSFSDTLTHDSADTTYTSWCRYCKRGGHSVADCRLVKMTCTKCGGKAHFADTCKKQGVPHSATCDFCGKIGHSGNVCWKKVQCTSCGRWGHNDKVCWNNTQCVNCKKMGHPEKHCPEKQVKNPPCFVDVERDSLLNADAEVFPVEKTETTVVTVETPAAGAEKKSWADEMDGDED